MGYYIETDSSTDKANYIAKIYNGKSVSRAEAAEAMKDPDKGVIVVVDNGYFEAAGFAFNQKEFEAFTRPDDKRYKDFIILDRELAKQLSEYRGE